jgi:hypothetical protein
VQPTHLPAPEHRPLARRAALTGLVAGVVGAALRSSVARAQEDTTVPESDTTVAEGTTVPEGTTPPETTTTAPPRRPTEDDRELLAFANSLELAAAELYQVALDTESLDEDTTTIAVGFADHHRQYAEAIAGLIGSDAPNEANEAIVRSLRREFEGDQESILAAAFELETAAAATHLELLASLAGTDGAALVASIQPIEARQATVLGDAIELPLAETVPELETTDAALDPAELPVD